MWWRSASFILDQRENDAANQANSSCVNLSSAPPLSSSNMADSLQNPNPNPSPNPNPISAYYQTRAAHHGVVTSDWLAQAQAAVGHHPDQEPPISPVPEVTISSGKHFSVIEEFNNWRKQPDLAEAVAAIRALASVIRASGATTMMELEIELKKASDSLKVSSITRTAHTHIRVCMNMCTRTYLFSSFLKFLVG